MRDLLESTGDARLSLADYRAEFQEHFWRIREAGFWKLERQQTFAEPGNDSWEAFARGDEHEAMRRLAAKRPQMADYYQRIAEHGFHTHRVRVFAEPRTTYLRWEFELLRMRSEFGAGVRVLPVEQVQRWEKTRPLPELVVLGTYVAYEVLYSGDGALAGGIRHRDPITISRCRAFIRELYENGTDLASSSMLADFRRRHAVEPTRSGTFDRP